MRNIAILGAAAIAVGLWASAASACELSAAAPTNMPTLRSITAAEAQPPSLAGTSGFALAKNRNAKLSFSTGGSGPSFSAATSGLDQITTAAPRYEDLLRK